MRVRFGLECRSALPRLAMVGLVSGLAAACSTDSARLAANPFSNPFAVSSAAPEPTATGALPSQPLDETMPAPAMPAAPVTAQPLAAPGRSVAYNQPAPVTPRAPVAAVPAAPRSVASAGPAGWSPQGGSTITVGQGDSLAAISTRYGVPASAILQANGLSTASQVSAGRTLVIPVFNAVGAPVAASERARPASIAPQPQMRLVEGAKPVPPKAVPAAKVEAKPAPKAAAPEPKRAEPVKAPARPVAAKPEPVKPAPVKTAQAAPKPEPVRPEPKKPEPKAPEAVKPVATRPVEPPKTVVQAQPKPEPQPQPQKVAALGNPPIASAPVAPAPAPAPAKPEPDRTASLPAANAAPEADFRWPARGRVISGFGTGGNEGINISVPEGTPVRAAEGGTVAYAGSELKGYGNLVLIRHDNGYVSAYAHNGALDVKRGEKVKRGQVIAKSGQSGNVNAPQLHFELRKGSTPIDPMPFLSN